MTCTSSSGFFRWTEEIPISFSEWKSILSKLNKEETAKRLSSSSTRLPTKKTSSNRIKKETRFLNKSQTFTDSSMVDSFLVSSSSNVNGPSILIGRQDATKSGSPTKKRYVSSFKTLVNSTNDRNAQKLNYINDSVMIFKLSKEKTLGDMTTENLNRIANESDLSQKYRPLTTSTSTKQHSSPSSETRLSPIMKNETHRRRTIHHEIPSTPLTQTDLSVVSNNSYQQSQNPSMTTYANVLQIANGNRTRIMPEPSTNSLLFANDKVKSNVPLSIRPSRVNLTAATNNLTSAYLSSQQTQRNPCHIAKPRPQLERIVTNRDQFDYPDPFTNCPPEILNRLSQLTKYQLETIEWEKKRRFTKKKSITNNTNQGKDSP